MDPPWSISVSARRRSGSSVPDRKGSWRGSIASTASTATDGRKSGLKERPKAMRKLMLASTFLAGFGTVAYGQTVITPDQGTLKAASGNTWAISSDGSMLETLSDG